MRIVLPWPNPKLNPHAKGHWRPKADATKSARRAAYWLAKEAKVACLPGATLTFEFAPPDKRRRDIHNVQAMMKATIDGIADAMGCDDNGFIIPWPTKFAEPVKGGRVTVTITPDVRVIDVKG